MESPLNAVQQRLAAYEQMVASRIQEFHDEKSMSYFSDRFGSDHPMSRRADYGTHLQGRLKLLRQRIASFADEVLRDFPCPRESNS